MIGPAAFSGRGQKWLMTQEAVGSEEALSLEDPFIQHVPWLLCAAAAQIDSTTHHVASCLRWRGLDPTAWTKVVSPAGRQTDKQTNEQSLLATHSIQSFRVENWRRYCFGLSVSKTSDLMALVEGSASYTQTRRHIA